MKKLYIITLALGVAATSYAAPQQKAVYPSQFTKSGNRITNPATQTSLTTERRATSRADETWKFLGEGEFSDPIFSNMFFTRGNDPIPVTVEESEQNPGRYRVTNPWADLSGDSYLIIDASDPGMVIIPEQSSGFDDPDDGPTDIASVSYVARETYGYNRETFFELMGEYNITMSDGIISFPPASVMFKWDAPTTEGLNAGEWYEARKYHDGYLALPGHKPVSEWELMEGKAIYFDGFVTTFITEDAPIVQELNIYKSNAREGFYKLESPYAYLITQSTERPRDLIIDTSDPEFVVVDVQSTGLITDNFGEMFVLSFSSMDFKNREDMEDKGFGDRNIYMEDDTIMIPELGIFAFFPEIDNVNVWANYYAVESYIKLPKQSGVGEIPVSHCDTPAYYNLQGIRIEQPAKGQLVIVKQNGKTFKQIFK